MGVARTRGRQLRVTEGEWYGVHPTGYMVGVAALLLNQRILRPSDKIPRPAEPNCLHHNNLLFHLLVMYF